MPPRKSLTSAPKRPRESESVTETVTSNTPTSDKTSKKRKIDWATIDDAKPFPGFTLHAPKAKTPKKSGNKRQKTRKSVDGGPNVSYKDAPLDANGVQQNPFEDGTLSEIHYLVKPTAEWESTLRYRKFTINESEFEVGQTIFVSKTEEAQDAESVIQHWIGKVLEVRAGDAAHVYLRVYWLYRPEDLPEGRQPYHAESELIASNHMDVIEALSVIDKATVIHWDEDIDKPWPLKDQLFWRQTYDVGKLKSRRLSSLRKVCVDQAPCNPDEGLVQCPSCSEWLHAHCLEDRAAKDAQAKNVTSTKKRNGAPESSAGVEFRARFTTLGESGPTYLTIEDMRPDHDHKRWNVDIKCLMCDQLIEQAAGDLPPEAALAAESVTLHSRQAIETEEEQNSVIDKEEDKGNIANPGSATIAPGESSTEAYSA
jgi:hypothetical protein